MQEHFSHVRKMEVALKLTENASLRGMQNEEGMRYLSVYDFVNFVTGHEPGDCYGKKTFYRIVKDGSEQMALSTQKKSGQIVTTSNSPARGKKLPPVQILISTMN